MLTSHKHSPGAHPVKSPPPPRAARHRRWTRDDTIGLLAASAILGAWCTLLVTLLTTPLAVAGPWLAVAGVLVQTFLYTGLFITAHDAMHGAITPSRRGLNDFIGGVAVFLYALFSYRKLARKHWQHHLHPGDPLRDPDFNNGVDDRLLPWYARFLSHYLSLPQLIGMAVVFNLLHHIADLATANLLLFWAVPALLSTLQLFYFGTWLPHRSAHIEQPNDHHSTSNSFPVWLSFLSCYHFGYHLEHHLYPRVPWWRLPAVRSGRLRPVGVFVPPPDPSTPSMS